MESISRNIRALNIRFIYLIIILISYNEGNMFSQSNFNIIDKFKEINRISKRLPSPGQIYFVDMIISTKLREGKNYASHIVSYIMTDKMRLTTDQVDILVDSNVAYTIINDGRKIFVTDAYNIIENYKKSGLLADLQDSLLTHCEVIECNQQSQDRNGVGVKATLKFSDDAKYPFNSAKIKIELNRKLMELIRLTIFYQPPYIAEEVIYQCNKIDYNLKLTEQEENQNFHIIDKNGKFVDKYSNYKIIDSRKK